MAHPISFTVYCILLLTLLRKLLVWQLFHSGTIVILYVEAIIVTPRGARLGIDF